jgi:hypothetical protein
MELRVLMVTDGSEDGKKIAVMCMRVNIIVDVGPQILSLFNSHSGLMDDSNAEVAFHRS